MPTTAAVAGNSATKTVLLRSIEELAGLLDRFLLHGETTTSVINATPVPRRDPPLDAV